MKEKHMMYSGTCSGKMGCLKDAFVSKAAFTLQLPLTP